MVDAIVDFILAIPALIILGAGLKYARVLEDNLLPRKLTSIGHYIMFGLCWVIPMGIAFLLMWGYGYLVVW